MNGAREAWAGRARRAGASGFAFAGASVAAVAARRAPGRLGWCAGLAAALLLPAAAALLPATAAHAQTPTFTSAEVAVRGVDTPNRAEVIRVARGGVAALRARVVILNNNDVVACSDFNQDLYARYLITFPAAFAPAVPGVDFGALPIDSLPADSESTIDSLVSGILHFPAGTCVLNFNIPAFLRGSEGGIGSVSFEFDLVGFDSGPAGLARLRAPGPPYTPADPRFRLGFSAASGVNPTLDGGSDSVISYGFRADRDRPLNVGRDYSSKGVRISFSGSVAGVIVIGDAVGTEPDSGVSQLRFPVTFTDDLSTAAPGFFFYLVEGSAVVDLPMLDGTRAVDPDIRLPAAATARRVTATDRMQDGFPQDVAEGTVMAGINFASGETTGEILVNVLPDDLAEPRETVELRVLEYNLAVPCSPRPCDLRSGIGKRSAVGHIPGNEPVELTLRAPAADVAEGNNIIFPLDITGGRFRGTLRVVYNPVVPTGSTATGADYRDDILNGDFRIRQEPDGMYSVLILDNRMLIEVPEVSSRSGGVNIPIRTALDSTVESPEALQLRISSVTALDDMGMEAPVALRLATDSATATIVDGVTITVAIDTASGTSMSVAEGQTAEIPVSLSGGTFTGPVTLICGYSTADTAQIEEDYTLGRIVEQRIVRGGGREVDAECGTVATGASSGLIRISLVREEVLETGFEAAEGDEDFMVNLVSISGATGDVDDSDFYTITIEDQLDNRVALEALQTEITEGQSATFTVALSGAATADPVTVPVSLVGIPAASLTVAGNGLSAAPGVNNYMLELAAGSGSTSSTATFTVAVSDDSVVGAMRALQVVLGMPSGGGGTRDFALAGSPLEVSVVDNDGVVVTLSSATQGGVSASEGGNARFMVAASQAPVADVTIGYNLGAAGDTALRGLDYSGSPSGSVTLTMGSSTANIDIPVTDDGIPEGVETFALRLTGITTGTASLGLDAQLGATATIARNDPVAVAISAAPTTVMEGEGVTFLIELRTGGNLVSLDQELVLDYSLPGTASATPNVDWVPPTGVTITNPGTLVIGAGLSSFGLFLTTLQDGQSESQETIAFQLDSVATLGGASLDTTDGIEFTGFGTSATATIAASTDTVSRGFADVQFSVTRSSAAVAAEGESVTFSLRRGGALPDSLTLSNYATLSQMPRIQITYDVSGVSAADVTSIAVTGGGPAPFTQAAANITMDSDLTGRTLLVNVADDMADPSIVVLLADDMSAEDAETLTLTLQLVDYPSGSNGWTDLSGFMTARMNAYGLATGTQATATIQANGRPLIGITNGQQSILGEDRTTQRLVTDPNPPRLTMTFIEDVWPPVGTSPATLNRAIDGSDVVEFYCTASVPLGRITNSFTVHYTLSGTATAGADFSDSGLTNVGDGTFTGSFSFPRTECGLSGPAFRQFAYGDNLSEPRESAVLTLDRIEPAGAAYIDPSNRQATVNIQASDPAMASVAPLFDSGATEAVEGSMGNAGMARFRFTLSAEVSVPVTLNYLLSGTARRTAADDGDYRAAADRGTLMFPARATSMDLALPVIDDTLSEAQETITLTILSVDGGAAVSPSSTDSSASVPIAASDPVTVSLATVSTMVTEGNTLIFTVNQQGGATVVPTVVAYTVSGVQAADYTDSLGGSLTIPAGQASGRIALDIVDDMNTETGGEMLTLTLDSATLTDPGSIGGAIALSTNVAETVTLLDPAAVTTRNVSVAATSAADTAEGASATFTVSLAEANPHTEIITVDWAVSATTAPGDDDAEAEDFDLDGDSNADAAFPGGTLNFAVGSAQETITLPIFDDTLRESQESYTVTLSNIVANASESDPTALGVSIAGGTIAASDPITYTISAPAADASFAEDSGALTITVTGTAAPGTGGNVECTISGDSSSSRTATVAGDFTALSATAAFGVSDTSANCVFTINDDMTNEPQEFFTVTLSNPASGGIPGAVATDSRNFSILASDGTLPQTPDPTVSAGTDQTADEGAQVTLSGTLTRGTGGTTDTLSYLWEQVDADSTTAGVITSVTLTGATGTGATANATFTGDVSAQETFYFRLTGTASATGQTDGTAADVVAVTINDIEPPTATITTPAADVDESTTTTLAATGTDPDGDSVTYAWTVAPAGPSFSDAAIAGPTVSWPAIDPVARSTAYTLTLTVTDSQGLSDDATVIFTVLDRDGTPTANAGGDRNVAPGASLTLDGSDSANAAGTDDTDLTYAWISVADAVSTTALNVGDPGYVALTGAATAMPSFTAPTMPGTIYLLLTVTDTQTSQTATARATVTVAVQFSIAVTGGAATVAEGATLASYTATITAMGGATRTQAVTLTWTVAGTSDTSDNDAEGADFCMLNAPLGALPTGTVTFSTTESSDNFLIPTLCGTNIFLNTDTLLEGEENFMVEFGVSGEGLSSVDSSGATTEVAITDADTATVSIARTDSDGFQEGGTGVAETAEFTVTIAGATTTEDAEITFNIGGDVGTGDYSSVPAAPTLTIPMGMTTGTITVTATDDSEIENAEDLTVTLTAVSSAGNISVGTPSSATAALADNDTATVSIARTDTDDFTEGAVGTNGTAVFAVTLSGALPENVMVPFSIAGGGGLDAADYDITVPGGIDAADTAGMLTINAGGTSGDITLTASSDNMLEGAETLTVTLGAPTGGGVTPTIATGGGSATADIADGNTLTATLSGGGNVAEGSNDVVTVMLSGARHTAPVVVNYTIAADADPATADATLTDDYTDADSGSITISPGVNIGTIINTVDDNLNEPGEVFVVTVTSVTSNGTVTAAGSPQTFTITDNDDIRYSIARVGGATVDEGDSLSFTITLEGGRLPTDAMVTATVSGDVDTGDYDISEPTGIGAAVDNADVTVTATTAMTGTATATATFAVSITGDTLNEAAEDLTVTIGAPSFAGNGTLTAGTLAETASINQNEPVVVTVMPVAASVDEGGNAVFTVTLAPPSAAAATVTFTESIVTQSASIDADGNAASNDAANPDFSLSTPSVSPLTINAGDASGTITIAVNADSLAEGEETLQLSVSGVTLGTGGGAVGTTTFPLTSDVTIPANTASTYQVNFAAGTPAAIAEDGMANTITVSLSGMATFTGNIEVDLTFTAGDTVAADFTGGMLPADTTLTFTQANRDLTFTITPAADTLVEGGSAGVEEFMLQLAAASSLDAPRQTALGGVQITTSPRTIGITDDDAIDLTVTPSGTSLAEDGGTVTYTVAFSGVTSTADVMVPFTIAAPGAGTAAGADDYDITMPGSIDPADTGGTLTITSGMSSETIVITGTADTLLEGDEGFSLTLGTLSGGGGATPTSTYTPSDVTITDAETVMASIARADSDGFTEGGIGAAGTAVFTVTVDGAELSADATVDFAVSGADATSDYTVTPTGGTLTINPVNGVTTATADITVTASSDNLNEGDETITVTISNPATASGTIALGTATATADIADAADDGIEVAIARVGTGDVAEDGTVDFTVSLSGGVRTADVVVPFEVTGLEEGEFDITMPASIPTTDTGGSVTFGVDGSETATDSLTISLDLLDDDLNEANETLTLTGTAPGATGLRTAAGVIAYATGGETDSVTVTDNDDISVSIARTTPAGTGAVSEGTNVVFTITLGGASSGSAGEVTVMWTATMGTQENNTGESSNDMTRPDLSTTATTTADTGIMLGGTLTIAANTASETLTITAASDGLAEALESFDVVISAPSGGTGSGTVALGTPATVNVGISANTSSVHALTVTGDATVSEGDSITYTVTKTGRAYMAATDVTWTVTPGAGAAAGDFNALTGMVSFGTSDGDGATQTFIVGTVENMVNEADKAFSVQVSVADANLDGSTSFGAAVNTSIEDDDPVTYSVGDATAVTEGDSGTVTMSFPVTLAGATGGSAAAIEIPYTLVGGTATGGTDYETPSSLTVTVPATMTTADLEITVNGDELNEADETIIVTLGDTPVVGAGGGTAMRAAAMADYMGTGMITDDDAITASIDPATFTIDEGASTDLTVTLDHASAADVTLSYTVAAAMGTGGTPMFTHNGDSSASGSITIDAGETTGTITLVSTPDSAVDTGDGTLTVALGTISVGADGGMASASSTMGMSVVTVNFRMFERFFEVAVDDVNTIEGDTATFTIGFTGTSTAVADTPAAVTWTLSGVETSDYTSPSAETGTLMFTDVNWATDQTVAVVIDTDNLNEGDETLTLTLSGATGGGGTGTGITTASASTTIDASDPITYSVSADTSVAEGDGTATATFTVTLIGATAGSAWGSITVPFSAAASSTAVVTDDYTLSASPLTFTGTDFSEDITVTITADDLNEAAETLNLELGATAGTTGSGGGAIAAGTDTEATLTITDDDDIAVSIARTGTGEVSEGDDVEFTITLDGASGGSAGPVMVSWTAMVASQANRGDANTDARPDLSAAGATASNNGGTLSGMLTIAAMTASETLTITAASDGFAEADESFTVAISGPSGGAGSGTVGLGSPASVMVGIDENEAALHVVTVTGPGTAVAEGGMAVFTLDLPAVTGANARTTALTVNYSLSGTATSGSDYTHAPSSATFAAGSISETVSITATADNLNEGEETLILTLTGVDMPSSFDSVGGAAAGGSASVTISASDPVTYSIGNPVAAAVTEGDSGTVTMSFPVTLSGATGGSEAAIEIPYTLGGDAIGGTDYETPSPLTVTVPATMTTANLDITVNGDELNEAAEDIIVTLGDTPTVGDGGGTAMRAAAQADYTGTGMITDDDAITASIDPATFTIDEGASTDLTITLDHASAADVTLSYTVAAAMGTGGTPMFTHNGDSSASGSITIDAGETTGTITLVSTPDSAVDTGDGTLTVALGTISVGAEGGMASASSTMGMSVVTVNFRMFERFFEVAVDDVNTIEGDTATFTIGFTGTSTAVADTPAAVTWTLSGVETSDYTSPSAETGTLMFTDVNWATAQTVAVVIDTDNLNEGDETLTLTLSGATGGGGTGTGITTASASTTIDASDPITYSVSADTSVAEGDGTATATFTVTLSGATAGSAWGSITVPFSAAASSTAVVTDDYTLSASPLTFTGTDFSEDITVTIAADDLNEAAETLNLELGATAGTTGSGGGAIAAGTDTEATLTITDDDAIAVSIARTGTGEVSEGDDVEFTITLGGASSGSAGPVMVSWTAMVASQANRGDANTDARPDLSAAGATASNNGGTLSGMLTIAAMTASETLTITAASDGFAEADESFTVAISAPSGGTGSGTVDLGSPASVMVGIDENEAALHVVTVSEPGTAVAEGGMAVFTLDLPAVTGANARTTALTVNYSLSGTATSGSDYTHAPTSVTFAAGSTSETVSITATADNLNEGEETLILTLTGVDMPSSFDSIGGAAAGGSASVTISASDPVTYSIGNPAAAVTEGDSGTVTMSFPVTLAGATGGSAAAIEIPYTLSGEATGGTDYETPSSLTVTVPATMTTANIDISVNGDDLNEAAEDIIVTLGDTPTVGDGGGEVDLSTTSGDDTGTGTITDDDAITVTLLAPDDVDSVTAGTQVNEASMAIFTVMLSGESAGDVSVTFAVTSTGATAGTDYTAPATTTATVPASMTSTPISIPIEYDGVDETGETLTVTISATMAGTGAGTVMLGTTASQTVDLVDVDALRTLSVAATTAMAAEGADLVFTLTVAGVPVTEAFNVGWSLDAASTAEAADVSGPAMVSFAVSATSPQTQTLTLRAVDDMLNEASETLTLTLTDPCAGMTPCSVGGRRAGDADTVPTLVLATATAAATIEDNDAISVMSMDVDGPAIVGESATAIYTVTLSAVPTTEVTLDWAVGAGTPMGDIVAAAEADFDAAGNFPADSLTFIAGVASQSLTFSTTDGAPRDEDGALDPDGSTDNTPDRAFTIALSNIMIMTGGGMVSMMPLPAAPFEGTIREDDPVARMERLEQTVAALNLANVSLAVQEIAPRLDFSRDLDRILAAPGLSLKVNGRQIFSSGGSGDAVAAADGIGLSPVPAARTLQDLLNASPSSASSAGQAGVPAAGVAMAGGALPGAAGPGNADDATRASTASPGDWEAARGDAAWEDPYAGVTTGDARSLAQMLGSSSFSATSNDGSGRLLSLWGSASHTRLDGQPEEAGRVLDYAGDSQAYYLGAERRYDNHLAGAALGYVTGDVEVKDPLAPDSRTTIENNMLMVHPYISWRSSDTLSLWLLGGLGTGDVDISVREADGTVASGTSDASLLMAAGGLSWLAPSVSVVERRIRLSMSVFRGTVDGGTLNDGRTYGDADTDAAQLRGEVELARPFVFESGMRSRPFLTAGVSYDFGDTDRDAATGEFGAGFDLDWPDLGLETQLEGQIRITNVDQSRRSYREYSVTGFVRYDRGGDQQGLQFSMRPSLGVSQASGIFADSTPGAALGNDAAGGIGAGVSGAESPAPALGLSSEVSYGIGAVRLWDAPGLFTLYGNSGMSQGTLKYGSGLRFEARRFSLDAGAGQVSSGGGLSSDNEFFLKGAVRF